MKSTSGFVDHWEDVESKKRLLNSPKSKDVMKADCENILKDMLLRYDRAPLNSVKYWANDIVEAEYTPDQLREVCGSIPRRFEKAPTLSQLFDLLRPYLANKEILGDELTRYTHLCLPHIKAKFIKLVDEQTLQRIVMQYAELVMPNSDFTYQSYEMCFLLDWMRAYFPPKPQAIVDQGRISNQMAEERNTSYFLDKLKAYAKEHNLSINNAHI